MTTSQQLSPIVIKQRIKDFLNNTTNVETLIKNIDGLLRQGCPREWIYQRMKLLSNRQFSAREQIERNRHVFVLALVHSENDTYDHMSKGDYRTMILQQWLSESKFRHIIIGIDDNQIKDHRLTCYEIRTCEIVTKKIKTLSKYDRASIDIIVPQQQYERLLFFLESKVLFRTPFNSKAFNWNFWPVLKWCPRKGRGYFCSELVAEALLYAGIINRKKNIINFNKKKFFLCCHVGTRNIEMKIPSTYQLNVEMVLEWIKQTPSLNGSAVPLSNNPNFYTKERSGPIVTMDEEEEELQFYV